MIIELDLLGEVVLLVDRDFQVRDALQVRGQVRHETPWPVAYYTYRRLLSAPGQCCFCGVYPEDINKPCSTSGGFHAFVGLENDPNVPDLHKVAFRSVEVHRLSYDEFDFYIEADNLFPIESLSTSFPV